MANQQVKPIRPLSKLEQYRFWSKVHCPSRNVSHTCWEWTGKRQRGYGICSVSRLPFLAHRVAYFIHNDVDPGEFVVMHKCDNPPCCNPEHLKIGTPADNTADRDAKGRQWHPAGEDTASSKLKETQVAELRALWAAGGNRQIDLARRFGVSQPTVSAIIRGRLWRHTLNAAADSKCSTRGSTQE